MSRLTALLLLLVATSAFAFASAPVSFDECDAMRIADPDSMDAYQCYYDIGRATHDMAAAQDRIEAIVAQEPGRTHARLYLGRFLSFTHDLARASDLLRGCAAEYVEADDPASEAYARYYLASNLMREMKLEESAAENEKAAELVAATNVTKLVGPVRFHRARIASLRGDEGLVWNLLRGFEQEPDFESMSLSLRQNIWDQLFMAAIDLKQLDVARDYAVKMRDHAEGVPGYRVNGFTSLARVATKRFLRGELERDEALAVVREAQVACDGAPPSAAPISCWGLRFDEIALLDGDEALPLLEQLAREANTPWHESRVLERLGARLAAHDPSRRAEAEQYLVRGLEAARSTGYAPYITRVLISLMMVRLDEADSVSATATAVETLDAVELLQDLQTGERVGALTLASLAGVYYAFVDHLLSTNEIAEDDEALEFAFDVGERLRARALVEHMSRTGPRDLESEVTERRTSTLKEISRTQLEMLTADGEDHQRLEANLKRLEAEEAALWAELSGLGVERLRQDRHPPVSVPEIHDELAGDEALLSFLVSPTLEHGSWLFVQTTTGLRAYPLPAAASLERAVPVWLQVIRRADDTQRRGAVRLYADLLAEALSDLPAGTRRLVVVPDGPLHRLPFDALRETEDGPALAELFEVTITPSATVWRRLREASRKKPASRVLLLADPESPVTEDWPQDLRLAWNFEQSLGRLPWARAEARRALNALGGNGELLEGAEASEAFISGSDLREYGLIHVAAHAVIDERQPGRSAILLAPGSGDHDGFLQAREVVDLDLDGATIALSACHSAGGELLTGEGVMGLARSFFVARASTVVGSLWPLRDEETAALMERFYRHLGRGETVSFAMALAKRDRIRAGAPASAWAGVVVLGAGTGVPATPGSSNSRVYGIVGAGLLLAFVGYLLIRRVRAARVDPRSSSV